MNVPFEVWATWNEVQIYAQGQASKDQHRLKEKKQKKKYKLQKEEKLKKKKRRKR